MATGTFYNMFTLESEEMEIDDSLLPVIPPPVPEPITKLQFWTQAALSMVITPAEALAVIQSNVLPSIMQNFLAGIDDDTARTFIQMKILGASQFKFDDVISVQFADFLGMTEEQRRSFWEAAHAIS